MVGLCDLSEVGFIGRFLTPRLARWRSQDVGFPMLDVSDVLLPKIRLICV